MKGCPHSRVLADHCGGQNGSQLGTGFRRQALVAGYIVDFLAPKVRLVVEVDGGYHALRARGDARRDQRLARAGYRVLRIEASRVMGNLPEAVARIVAAL